MVERKLYKTKLCVLYQKGHCHRQTCSFAHGNAELRRSFNGGLGDNMKTDVAVRPTPAIRPRPSPYDQLRPGPPKTRCFPFYLCPRRRHPPPPPPY